MRLVIISIAVACSISCAKTPPAAKVSPFQPPRINMRTHRYYLDGCDGYSKIDAKYLLETQSVQEAEMSGYLRGCPKEYTEDRLRQEKEIMGEIVITPEIIERRRQELLNRQLGGIQQTQDEIRDNQQRLDEKFKIE